VLPYDPPAGILDARRAPALDRFTVTCDKPNYVYLDGISVESFRVDAPQVLGTRRLEDGAPETVEIVLDRPIPFGGTTRFSFDDGEAINILEYTHAEGDTDGDGDADLRDAATFQYCFGQSGLIAPCPALDVNDNDTIDLDDYAAWLDIATIVP